ncbi:hypothetical protein P152DRAFT_344138 [Eremomyces bilateralis CBS 781.70]|uniref:TPR-like protein n=1 Tax=Eremomyces bilateralis CBS 781.70 TaxID=1392243 RepID=A0A6G1G3D2_9PEZI|nr:uncharacterized protein P152DRAFT_344138 [Eremomyces bilateralis CBS 781.70]KAF1812615.1 hypothetical protein P152DRAFT_344138 [Eremomyces bilateralis CBS 781.70]
MNSFCAGNLPRQMLPSGQLSGRWKIFWLAEDFPNGFTTGHRAAWSYNDIRTYPLSAFASIGSQTYTTCRPVLMQSLPCTRSGFSSSAKHHGGYWKTARSTHARRGPDPSRRPLPELAEKLEIWMPHPDEFQKFGLLQEKRETARILQTIMGAKDRTAINLEELCRKASVDIDKFATFAHYLKFKDGDGSAGWSVQGRLGQKALQAAADVGNRTAVHAFIHIGLRSHDIHNEVVKPYIPILKGLAEDNVGSMILYGKVLEEQGDLPAAESVFKQATKALQGWMKKRNYNKEVTKEMKAEKDMARMGAQWVYHRRISAWTSLALVQFDLGKTEEAKISLKRGADVDGDPYACYFYANLIASIKDGKFLQPANAEWHYYMTRAAMAGDPQAAYALGMFYYEHTSDTVADKETQKILELPATALISWWQVALKKLRSRRGKELTFATVGHQSARNRLCRSVGFYWLDVAAQSKYWPAVVRSFEVCDEEPERIVRQLQLLVDSVQPDELAKFPDEIRQAKLMIKNLSANPTR